MSEHQLAPRREDLDDEDLGRHLPGDIVAGKYQLLRVIGAGGMGTVWAATNLDLDLEVALKLINRQLDSDETRARLATEARAEARVQHRGIVRVLDLGVTDQHEPFLVMERLAGRSLGDLLDECGHLDSVDAVRLMLPVLEALAAVHERGVVHRDLKPDNIFLSEHGGRLQPKIVDFGIAVLEGAPSPRRTGRGAVVGSPGYMAPEHARGGEVDLRADIFTAALVLYESITGRPAFQGSNYNSLLRAVIERQLEPITSFGRGDPVLSRILERGLRKVPAARYASCLEFGRALATWLLSQGETEDVTGHALAEWWQTDEAGASPRNTRRGRAGHAAFGSMHGVSFSTTGVGPARPIRRRLAFVALACSGFAGGFAATTAADFPGHSPRGSERPAAAASLPGAKTDPSETQASDGPAVRPVSVATAPKARVLSSSANDGPTSPPASTERRPQSKPQAPSKKQSVYPEPAPTPFDHFSMTPEPEAPTPPPPHPGLTLPPDPPPPGALIRLNDVETDLKDPYQ